MGAVYTNTDNAIACTNNIEGPRGKKGYTGGPGAQGNKAVWMPYNPTKGNIILGLQRGEISPVDKDGNGIPSNLIRTLPNSTWPVQGDLWVDYTDGNVYRCGTTGDVSSFTYVYNRRGVAGADNFLKTEVSFNGKDSVLGFPVTKVNVKTLVGHFIYPGKDVTGNINNVKVLLNTNTENNDIRAAVYLVNLGNRVSGIDDIVVASATDKLISGKGDDTSWQIVDLAVNNVALPSSQAVFGVFVLLRATRRKEIDHIKELTDAYNAELAASYAERLRDTERATAGAFYEVLEQNKILTEAESPIRRQKRIAEREAYLTKRAKAEADAAARLQKSTRSLKIPFDIKNVQDIKNIWTYTPITFEIDVKVAHITIS